jgi:hypothetical protein
MTRYHFSLKIGDGSRYATLEIQNEDNPSQPAQILHMTHDELEELRFVIGTDAGIEYQSSLSIGTDAKGGSVKLYLPMDQPEKADQMITEAFRLKDELTAKHLEHLMTEESQILRKVMEGEKKEPKK